MSRWRAAWGSQGAYLVVAVLLTGGAAGAPMEGAGNIYLAQREGMVAHDIHLRGVRNEAVLEAMRTVPRHEFVPPGQLSRAYDDYPLPIGYGQTISQPYIVAAMTEMLEPKPDFVVLEIGTGSGYQAAVLSPLVRQVYTIEIIPELAETARERLARLGYDNVTVRTGDGYHGWEEQAPFDGIIVTAAATHIPPPLLEQLKPGGRMVIPVGPPLLVQSLMLVSKGEDGSIVQRNTMAVRFVPLRGGTDEE